MDDSKEQPEAHEDVMHRTGRLANRAEQRLPVLVLLIINPVRLTRPTRLGKAASLILLAAITIDNTAVNVLR